MDCHGSRVRALVSSDLQSFGGVKEGVGCPCTKALSGGPVDGFEVLRVVVVGVARVVLVDDQGVITEDVPHAEVGNGEDYRVPDDHVPHRVEQLQPHQPLLLPWRVAQDALQVHALNAVPSRDKK